MHTDAGNVLTAELEPDLLNPVTERFASIEVVVVVVKIICSNATMRNCELNLV